MSTVKKSNKASFKYFQHAQHVVRVTTAKTPWSTHINGTFGSITAYFLKQAFDVGTYPEEDLQAVYCIEFLDTENMSTPYVRVAENRYRKHLGWTFKSAIQISVMLDNASEDVRKFAEDVVNDVAVNFPNYAVLSFERERFLETDHYSFVGVIARKDDLGV